MPEQEEPDWIRANRANWDERVPIHLASYDLEALRSGAGRLHPIEESELSVNPGERALHLQCHFGRDTLTLAQRGLHVTGIDFSPAAIDAARALSRELALEGRSRFLLGNVYDALQVLPEPQSFDLVFVTWGAINWLPDIVEWARVVASFLKPGGRLYLAEGHPAAYVFDDEGAGASNLPGWFVPYFGGEPAILDNTKDYSNPNAVLVNSRQYEWVHPLGEIISALLAESLRIVHFKEHDAVPWRMFASLVEGTDGMFRWPGKRWLPLGFSIIASKPFPQF